MQRRLDVMLRICWGKKGVCEMASCIHLEEKGMDILMIIQKNCKCGKEHIFSSEVILGEGVLQDIPAVLKKYYAIRNTFFA